MWVKKNFGRGDCVNLAFVKTITPDIFEEFRESPDGGKQTKRTVYVIYADDSAIFRSFDKEKAETAYEWIIKTIGAHSMAAAAFGPNDKEIKR